MKVIKLVGLIGIVFYQVANAQITTYREFNASMIFKSPQVDALEKYIDFPVDYSTGTVNIDIPIYTIQAGDFQLPISLKYNTGGIKVDQMATNVGLGWMLNAGGAISRSVQGTYPDEKSYGIYSSKGEFVSPSDYLNDCGCFECYPSFLDYDSEPDIFLFNVNGLSGKFIFDFSRNIHKIPEQDVQIKENYSANEFTQWVITAPDGTKYIFRDQEKSYTVFNGQTPEITTAWLLNQIITTNQEVINFYYETSKKDMISEEIWSPETATLTLWNEVGNISGITGGYKIISYQENLRLTSIEAPNCVVYFNYSSDTREDLRYKNSNSGKALQEIIIKNRLSGKELKRYALKTSYFNGENQHFYPETFKVPSSSYKRLKLDAVQEIDDTNIISSYQFSYNKNNPCPDCIPARLSMARDHWGYYNGHDENTHLLPTNKFKGSLTLADREPNANKKKAFILDEIKYPTGGVAKFFYESDVAGGSAMDLNTMHISYVTSMAGGLRIAKSVYDPNDGGKAIEKKYSYDVGRYSMGAPIHFFDGNYGDTHVTTPTCHSVPMSSCVLTSPSQIFSTPINALCGIENNFVYHSYVEIKETGNGYTSYSYNSMPDLYREGIDPNWWESKSAIAICPFFLNKPSNVTLYDESGNAVKSTHYNYKTYYRQILFPTDHKILRVNYDASSCYRYYFYPLYTGYSYLKDVTEKEFRGKKTITTTKTYDYAKLSFMESSLNDLAVFIDHLSEPDHHFSTTINEKKSNGFWLRTKYKFPLDYSLNDRDAIIENLIINNIINDPIETTSILDNGTASTIVDAQYLKYAPFGGTMKLNKIYRLSTTTPITESGFSFGSMGTAPNGKKDFTVNTSLMEPKATFTYDNSVKLVEESLADNIPTSYLWGYNQTYPIAKAVNAYQNEIFFDSFEENSGWDNSLTTYDKSMAHSGNYSGKIVKTTSGEQVSHSSKWLSITLPASKKFKYSGWIYSNSPSADLYFFMKRASETGYYSYVDAISTSETGKWVFLEKEFEVPADVTQLNLRIDNNGGGTVFFDDLRICPAEAQMTTYTYDPLKGITSSTDENNMTTYFQYDNIGRLITIVDKKGNIVKTYKYNYKQ